MVYSYQIKSLPNSVNDKIAFWRNHKASIKKSSVLVKS